MLKFDISNVKGSEKKLLQIIIQQQNWIDCDEQHEKANIVWNQRSEDKCKAHSCQRPRSQIHNKIKGVGKISQKAQSVKCCNSFGQFYPDIFSIIPDTIIYPDEKNLLYSKNLNHYIAKPSGGSEGKGIFFPISMNDLIKRAGYEKMVIQKYIENPMLINKKKFDLRFYVLISQLNPLCCFINKEGLVRICVDDYDKLNKDQFSHLTNFAINCENKNYVPCQSENFLDDNQSNKQSFQAFRNYLKKNGKDDEAIFLNIEKAIAKFIEVVFPFILYHGKKDYENKPKNFCIIGLDVLLDDKEKVYILEMNSCPSLQITQFKNNQEEISQFDLYVKEKVVKDAILICTKKEDIKQTSYKLISDQYQLENNIVIDLLNVFWFCGKGSQQITCSQFLKLSNFSGMTNEKINRVDYQILFCRNQCQKIDFYQFLELIVSIAKKMNITYQNLMQMIRV